MINKEDANILIVDDIEDNRYTLERRLKRDGYTNIFLAEGGKSALEMAVENKFDLILLDLMMPDMSGLEVLKHLKGDPLQRSIPVMITLFVIFIGMVFFISFREPSRTTLFSSLPEHEKSRVIDVLRSNGIDVSIDSTTGEVLVPSPEYYEAKMKLAAEGLPSSVPQGYDLLEKIPMGTSRSVEFMKMKQTQEIQHN